MSTESNILLRIAAAAGMAFAALAADPVQACSCRPPGSPQQELAEADTAAVFRGRVLEIEERDGMRDLVTFAASAVWKGPRDPLHAVLTPRDQAGCGIDFEPGREYVVYEQVGGSVTQCTRTAEVDAAAADLAELGAGYPLRVSPLRELVRHAQLAGSWYNPQHPGEGFVVEFHEGDRASVYWFGYDGAAPDRQAWMTGIGSFDGEVLEVEELVRPTGGGFGDTYRPDLVQYPVWGSLRLTLYPDGSGDAEFTSTALAPMESVSFPITRLTRPPAPPLPAEAR